MYTVLGGAGRQGRAIVHYLLENTDDLVEVVDFGKCPAVWDDKVKWTSHGVEGLMYSKDDSPRTVISCLEATTDYYIVKDICIPRRWDCILLGGLEKNARALVKLAEQRTIGGTIIPDCGLAPGVVSTIAGELYREGHENVDIYCGGIPQTMIDRDRLRHAKSFSPAGLWREYTGPVLARENRKPVYYPALSDHTRKWLTIGGDTEMYEWARTSGGLSLTPERVNLRSLNYYTLRWPNHFNYVKENIAWQPDPVDILDKMLPEVSCEVPDQVILRYKTEKERKTWCWMYDFENDISAMAQATGYIAAAIATLVAEKLRCAGLVFMDELDLQPIIDRCKQMRNQWMEA